MSPKSQEMPVYAPGRNEQSECYPVHIPDNIRKSFFMNICDHFIKKRCIIGIGPLMRKLVGDQADRQFYGSYYLYFSVYLEHHTIELRSDVFCAMGMDEAIIRRDSDNAKKFKNQHLVAYTEISKMES